MLAMYAVSTRASPRYLPAKRTHSGTDVASTFSLIPASRSRQTSSPAKNVTMMTRNSEYAPRIMSTMREVVGYSLVPYI